MRDFRTGSRLSSPYDFRGHQDGLKYEIQFYRKGALLKNKIKNAQMFIPKILDISIQYPYFSFLKPNGHHGDFQYEIQFCPR